MTKGYIWTISTLTIIETNMSTNIAIIQTCTGNLSASKIYYQKLGFTLLSENDPTLLTDGQFLLEINPQKTARTGLKLYRQDWSEVVAKMEQMTTVVLFDTGHLISDPNGVKVYLMQGEMNNTYDLTKQPTSILGNFAGLSIEAVDVAKTINFWQTLGYQKTMGSLEQGWLAFTNETAVGISIMRPLMCPHLFFNPSITYFNGGKNLPVIDKIRSVNIPIIEEITVFNREGIVDNVILCDSGGLGCFVFND